MQFIFVNFKPNNTFKTSQFIWFENKKREMGLVIFILALVNPISISFFDLTRFQALVLKIIKKCFVIMLVKFQAIFDSKFTSKIN